MLTKERIITIFSWITVIWICKVFLTSIPYKFTNHPDTVHIFSTIGAWMSDTIAVGLGNGFTRYGALVVGTGEIIASLILLSPLLLYRARPKLHLIGGLLSSALMGGAVFFHLFTPLGVEVLHEGKSDGGSLFIAAVSILILGLVLFVTNFKLIKSG